MELAKDPLEEQEEESGRVSGSATGEAAARIKALAKELKCSSRDIVEAMLTYCDPTPAIKIVLDARLERESAKVAALKKKFSK